MDNQSLNKLYQEYADDEAERNGDLYGTERFRQTLAASPLFQRKDPLVDYEQRLQERALKELRTTKEWHHLEAEDIRWRALGAMRHMSAEELLERYTKKIQQSYKAEAWHQQQISQCNIKIAELETWQTQCKTKERRLQHWRKRRICSELALQKHTAVTNRYEKLITKWRSIVHQLRETDIAREIAAERNGNGNKYGFNPNMQSRATAIGMFSDFE